MLCLNQLGALLQQHRPVILVLMVLMALVDAFSHEFHYATRLTCFIHFRRNIKKRLHDQRFPESEARVVLDNICQQGHVFSEGLVDCKSEEEFNLRWDNIEGANPNIQPHGFALTKWRR